MLEDEPYPSLSSGEEAEPPPGTGPSAAAAAPPPLAAVPPTLDEGGGPPRQQLPGSRGGAATVLGGRRGVWLMERVVEQGFVISSEVPRYLWVSAFGDAVRVIRGWLPVSVRLLGCSGAQRL